MRSKTALQQALEDYRIFIRVEKNLAPRTIREYRDDLFDFAQYISHKFGLKAPTVDVINKNHIKRFLEHLQADRGFESTSLARIISSLRGLFLFCLEQEYLDRNPMDGIRTPKHTKKLPIYLVQDELRRLFAEPDQSTPLGIRDHAILVTLANTGLRVSEITGIVLDSLDFSNGSIRVFGKGRKERLVPMNETVKAVLSHWLNHRPEVDTQAVFVRLGRDYGKPLSPRGIQHLLKKHGRAANIPSDRLTPHKLRHTFATLLHMSDVDILDIQALLGHADISSTQIYTHTDAGRLRSAVERLPPIDPTKD